ncbi:MAG: hypothetical protein ACODAQ_06075 [Phycisphaeraceae bacterium]
MDRYLATWGQLLRDRITVLPYESLVRVRELPAAATYIFSDLERLTPARRALAVRLHEQIDQNNTPARVLNHPARSLRRYDLLRTLHAKGINRFQVRRVREPLSGLRYPVFLRLENDHGGSRTELLHDAEALKRAIDALRWRHGAAEALLIVEFCDTSDAAGVFRKYAAFVVSDQIIPRHVLFGRNWMLKEPELAEADLLEERRTFVRTNPHAAELRRICAEAGITYGRVDYGIVDGQVQVWEINTNPTILREPEMYSDRNFATHRLFARRIGRAFHALDGAGSAKAVPLNFDWRMKPALVNERAGEWFGRRGVRLRRWLSRAAARVRGWCGGSTPTLLLRNRRV